MRNVLTGTFHWAHLVGYFWTKKFVDNQLTAATVKIHFFNRYCALSKKR